MRGEGGPGTELESAQGYAAELIRFGQLLEGATDLAIIMLDPYGRVMTWSASAQRVLGYPGSDAIGMFYGAFFDEGEQSTGLPGELLTKAVASGRAQTEGKRIRQDGSMLWAHSVVTALREDDGQLRGFVKDAGLLDMTAMAAACWEQLAPARAGRDVQFVLRDLPPAAGDPRLTQQVWLNLLDNAIKYTAKAGRARIEVSGQREGDVIAYRVSDNGAGFDMRYVQKLGQVFQRLHRSEDFAGTGIGLALVQRIVNRHGGRLLASGEPGVGAVMGFALPAEFAGELADLL